MEEYVAKSTLKKELNIANLHSGIVDALQNIVDEIPAADVQEVKHGHWIITRIKHYDFEVFDIKCSNCKERAYANISSRAEGKRVAKYRGYAYCSYCGARMDGEK